MPLNPIQSINHGTTAVPNSDGTGTGTIITMEVSVLFGIAVYLGAMVLLYINTQWHSTVICVLAYFKIEFI